MAHDGSDARMGEAWIGKVVSRIGEAAGVRVAEGKWKGKPHTKYASCHDLRRSFATRWVPKVMPATLQKLMRHKSINTTLDYYAEVQSEAVGDELRRLDVTPMPLRDTLRDKGHFEAEGPEEKNRQTPIFKGSF
jgi:integrase